MTGHGDHVGRNREYWRTSAERYAEAAPRLWDGPPSWGQFGLPDSEVHVLPDVTGLDVVELGCGTGYVSAWVAGRGARRVVGLDPTSAQLDTARRMQARAGLVFPLVQADAELAPFAAGSFDVAISEYGAAIWCDPYRWIPEAARLLRPGGRLIFLGNSVVFMLCAPDDVGDMAEARMLRPQRGIHRFEWPDDPSVEFHVSHGDMIRLLRSCGFVIEDLVELYTPGGDERRAEWVDAEWASRWPLEEVWIARKS